MWSRPLHPTAWPTGILRRIRRAARAPNHLTELANRFGSDKGDLHKNKHYYTRVYHSLFAPLRLKPLRLLEIGLLHTRDLAWSGSYSVTDSAGRANRAPSLAMWAEYFPNATLFGFDKNDFSGVKVERCAIFRGDAGSRDDLARMVSQSGGSFDVVIDDASHASHHQQIALGALFKLVVPGGLYVIEDLHWQPPELERDGITPTRTILREAQAGLPIASSCMTSDEITHINDHLGAVWLFDSLEGKNPVYAADALGVIRKKT